MEKQDIPITPEHIEEKTKGLSFVLSFFMTFFYSFLFVGVGISLFLVSYLLYLNGEFELMVVSYFLLKGLVFFWACSVTALIIRAMVRYSLESKMNFIKRRNKIKEEIKKEVIKEMKTNGRKR